MEDCRYVNEKKPRERKKLGKGWTALILFITVIIGALLYLTYVVNPVILESSVAKVRSLTSKAIGSAVYEVINAKIYDPLIEISKDNDGNISHLSVNAILVNQLTRELTRNAQAKLDVIGTEGVDVPLGSFTGLPIFAGRGTPINLKLVPVGSISARYETKFTQAGINQTLHQIYVYISTQVDIILPLHNESISTETQVILTENIIIGKIPDTYLNSKSLDEMLNLA